MFIVAIPLFVTGIIKLRFVMSWLSLERTSGVVLIVLVVIHLALHTEWIKVMTKQIFYGPEDVRD